MPFRDIYIYSGTPLARPSTTHWTALNWSY